MAMHNGVMNGVSEHDVLKVTVLGSGNWGATIARIVGQNTAIHNCFEPEVVMWVFEEILEGRKLSEMINETHENIKYLPGVKLPGNVVAQSDLLQAVRDSDILVFALPFQFVKDVCHQIAGHTKHGAFAISLIKGLDVLEERVRLISQMISDILSIEVSALIGANIAKEVAEDRYCEATIGSRNEVQGELFHKLFDRPTFRVKVVRDQAGVEVFGALKYIVGTAAGLCDGLEYADSTKSAIVCLGAQEMWKFCNLFFPKVQLVTFLENCGLGDLFVASTAGRNRLVAEALVSTNKPVEVLERELLNGQKMQGPRIARQVHLLLKEKKLQAEFPLFSAVYTITHENCPPHHLLTIVTGDQ